MFLFFFFFVNCLFAFFEVLGFFLNWWINLLEGFFQDFV